jgi:hypothetical protein
MKKIEIIKDAEYDLLEQIEGVLFQAPRSSDKNLKYIKAHTLKSGVEVENHYRWGKIYPDNLGGSFVTCNLFVTEDFLGEESIFDVKCWIKKDNNNPDRMDIIIDLAPGTSAKKFELEIGSDRGLIPIQQSDKYVNIKPIK